MTTAIEDQRELTAIRQLRERLIAVGGDVSAVNAAVDRAIRHFATAPVRAFVPLLVERRARDELKAAGSQPVQAGK
jgi:microcompartment protein CcmL/EutN